MIGTSLGPYKIIEPLGAGGMGEVYLGEDTRLGRKVAVKVLPAAFASDPERLARFEQEARAAAALNHPHIAVVHDVGSEQADDGTTTHFMVQEYLEGQSLREWLQEGALRLDSVLDLAIEVGEALKAAHRAGIVHRDLKPDNVFITADGHAKVLDFGLAKLAELAAPVGADASMSPTMLGTIAGQVMGTAGYMAPEQAAGAPDIDYRADVFSFGCVLYEMASSRRPFAGRSVAETLAQIQHDEPASLTDADSSLPAELQRVLGKCLRKQPGRRYQHADDLVVDLRALRADIEAGTAPSIAETMPAAASEHAMGTGPQAAGPRTWAGYAATAVVTALVVWLAASSRAPSLPSGPVSPRSLSITLPADTPLEVETWRPALSISPAGDRIVYVGDRAGRTQLFLRDLGVDEVVPIDGTADAVNPFFSPDGESIGFFADDWLTITSLAGGAPTVLARNSPVTRGADWGDGGSIAVTPSNNSELRRYSASGGEFPHDAFRSAPLSGFDEGQVLTQIDPAAGINSHRWPKYLPGGEAVLFTVDTGGSFDNADIAVLSLASGEIKRLIRGGTNAHYSPTGHIVFARAGNLLAAPFDVETLEVTAPPTVVLEGVLMEPGGAAHFSLSRDGTLVYVPGGLLVPNRRLVWVDRAGERKPLRAEPREYMAPRVSPNGQRVAVTIRDGSNYDVWVVDAQRGGVTPFTTDPGEDFGGAWTADGRWLAYASEEISSPPTAWWRRADASSPGEPLMPPEPEPGAYGFPSSWAPDGNILALITRRNQLQTISMLSLADDSRVTEFFATEGNATSPMFSPNGDWIVFSSDHTGRTEVYLKRVDGEGGLEPVSIGGGAEPVWSRDGGEIFFRDGDKLMAVSVAGSGTDIELGTAELVFEERFLTRGPSHMRRNYDVGPDGRFLMIERERDLRPTELKVVLNFDEFLQQRVPREK